MYLNGKVMSDKSRQLLNSKDVMSTLLYKVKLPEALENCSYKVMYNKSRTFWIKTFLDKTSG